MPKRDTSKAEGTGTGLAVSRRAVLAGVGIALCFPPTGWAAGAPLRVGVPGGLGLRASQLAVLCGRAVSVVPFDGWGALVDHAACGGAGLIDAAVLPGAGPALAVAPAALWSRPGAAPTRVGVPVAHPSSDAALRRLLGPGLRIVPLPTRALEPNLAAGLLDAAVLLGRAPAASGLRRVPLAAADAAALLPPLALVALGVGA